MSKLGSTMGASTPEDQHVVRKQRALEFLSTVATDDENDEVSACVVRSYVFFSRSGRVWPKARCTRGL